MEKIKFIKRFVKFAVVGLIGAIVHLGMLYILTEFLSVYYILSSAIGFVFANMATFVLNKTWTFEEHIYHKIFNKYTKFLSISLIAFGINLSCLYLFTELFNLYYVISQVLAIFISLWINFFGNHVWTFKNLNENNKRAHS